MMQLEHCAQEPGELHTHQLLLLLGLLEIHIHHFPALQEPEEIHTHQLLHWALYMRILVLLEIHIDHPLQVVHKLARD